MRSGVFCLFVSAFLMMVSRMLVYYPGVEGLGMLAALAIGSTSPRIPRDRSADEGARKKAGQSPSGSKRV